MQIWIGMTNMTVYYSVQDHTVEREIGMGQNLLWVSY